MTERTSYAILSTLQDLVATNKRIATALERLEPQAQPPSGYTGLCEQCLREDTRRWSARPIPGFLCKSCADERLRTELRRMHLVLDPIEPRSHQTGRYSDGV